MTHRGATFEEMDVDAVLARRPQVVLVDELAHTNVPGSRNAKRYQDVEELLDAGIDVISTVNVQHLESVNDVVEQITGVKQRETVPDAVVRAADQVELVDMTPEALRRRMAHGNIYRAEKVDAALGNYFRVGNLSALRELALLWVADKVDAGLQDYMEAQGIASTWETRERVVVAVTGAPSGEHLIRRAARIAQRTKADLLGVHVQATDGLADAPPRAARAPPPAAGRPRRRPTTRSSAATWPRPSPSSPAASTPPSWCSAPPAAAAGPSSPAGSIINAVLREAGDIDVHVISDEEQPKAPGRGSRTRPAPPSPAPPLRPAPGRRLAADRHRHPPADAAAVAVRRARSTCPPRCCCSSCWWWWWPWSAGFWPALVAAVVASLAVNWFFTEPIHTFTIAEGENLVALVTFLVVAGPGERAGDPGVAALGRRQPGPGRGRGPGPRGRRPGRRRRRGGRDGRPPARRPSTATPWPCWCPTTAAGWSRRRRARILRSPPTGHASVPLDGGAVLVHVGPAAQRRRPAGAAGVRRPARLRPRAAPAQGRGGRGRGAGRGRPAAHRHPAGGVARPAHAAGLDQGVGHQPAAGGRRLDPDGPPRVPGHHRRGGRPAQRPGRQPARHEPARDRGPRRWPCARWRSRRSWPWPWPA